MFRKTFSKNLSKASFIDVFSQTLVYGIFLARLTLGKPIQKKSSFFTLPNYLKTIKEIFKLFELPEIPNNINWIVDEIINEVNGVELESITTIKARKVDPYIYFYEEFLEQYNKKERKFKGVYYTPIYIVSFIVRSVEKVLQRDFQKTGFSDDSIIVLDFAAGTGTFLLEVFRKAISNVNNSDVNQFIEKRFLKNFYGFEYLITPYVVAHMKLAEYLKKTGYTFKNKNEIKICLTDTLDFAEHHFCSTITTGYKKWEEVYNLKTPSSVLVIVGNPPYSIHSANKQSFALNLIKKYKQGLNEKKINLDDDYIKFIAFAQWKIEQAKKGIVGIISNNSYLDGLIHRMMRKSLLQTFDKIYIINLHGNSNRGESDKNVFNIKVGTAIALFIKLEKPHEDKQFFYFSTLDNNLITREEKSRFLDINDLGSFSIELKPKAPNYWFVPKDLSLEKEYKKGWSIIDIFKLYGSGFKTERDNLTVHFNMSELQNTLEDFVQLDEQELQSKYNLYNSRDWKITNAKRDISFTYKKNKRETIKKVLYRCFDHRYMYFSGVSHGFIGTPQRKIASNFYTENIGLVFTRQIKSKDFAVFITNAITCSNCLQEWSYIAPLYLKNIDRYNKLSYCVAEFNIHKKYPNFTPKFNTYIKARYNDLILTPEQILGYIYAVLHSFSYRKTYIEFLKIDFPHIPFVKERETFLVLSRLGQELIDHHLLKKNYSSIDLLDFLGKGDFHVEKLKYEVRSKKLYVNKKQYFKDVAKEVWEFKIGNYQILKKFLKVRRGRKLTIEEIERFKKIYNALKETIILTKKISKIFKGDSIDK